MKGFVFNRKFDWEEGKSYSQDVVVSDNSISFRGHSFFFSRLLDSNESGTYWSNLLVKSNIPANARLIFRVFSSDMKNVVVSFENNKDTRIDLDSFFEKEYNPELKLSVFNSMNCLTFENSKEVPLFELKGRYIAFCVEAINHFDTCITIEELQINFPFNSFVQYLPEVYQNVPNSAFLHRFISIFQSMYLELEEIIDNIPEKFEPSFSDPKFINWICNLFDLDSSIYSEAYLRDALRNMTSEFMSYGTRNSLVKTICSYIHDDPILVEKFRITHNDYYIIEKELVDKLFGGSNYNFTVILKETDIKNEKCYADLLKIIHERIPIDAICNLVILTDNIILGVHCYIGVNSRISNSYVQRARSNFIKLGA